MSKKTEVVAIRMSPIIKIVLKTMADESNQSMSSLINNILSGVLNDKSPEIIDSKMFETLRAHQKLISDIKATTDIHGKKEGPIDRSGITQIFVKGPFAGLALRQILEVSDDLLGTDYMERVFYEPHN